MATIRLNYLALQNAVAEINRHLQREYEIYVSNILERYNNIITLYKDNTMQFDNGKQYSIIVCTCGEIRICNSHNMDSFISVDEDGLSIANWQTLCEALAKYDGENSFLL